MKDKKQNKARLQGEIGNLTSQMRRLNNSIKYNRRRLRGLPPGSPHATTVQNEIFQQVRERQQLQLAYRNANNQLKGL